MNFMLSYLRSIVKTLFWILLGTCACLADVCAFACIGYPFLQFLLCIYVLSLSITVPTLAVASFLLLLAVQSFIFFSNGFLLLALAGALALPLYVLRQLLHVRSLAPFGVLCLGLIGQLVLLVWQNITVPQTPWLVLYFVVNLSILTLLSVCFYKSKLH